MREVYNCPYLLCLFFKKVRNTWVVSKILGYIPFIKERFMRLVSGSLRALLKVLNNFVSTFWGHIALSFFE